MGSSSESGDEDEAAGLQAQVAQMMGPIHAKVKKANKKIDKLEMLVDSLKHVESDSLPTVRKELTAATADISIRLERVQADVAQLASKTQLEVTKQEARVSENRLRTSLDAERGRSAAQQLAIQGLESRIDAMERTVRESELKVGSSEDLMEYPLPAKEEA